MLIVAVAKVVRDKGVSTYVYRTIYHLQNCISDSGYLILELASTPDTKAKIDGLPTETQLLEQLAKSDLEPVDKIFWESDIIRAIIKKNNRYSNKRIEGLKKANPKQTQIFERYLSNQIDECKLIEDEMICSTWILKR